MAASETVEAVLEHPAPEPVVEPLTEPAAARRPRRRKRAKAAADLTTAILPKVLGPGWEIQQPAEVVAILLRQPALHASLACRAALFGQAAGAHYRIRVSPADLGDGLALDLLGDETAADWFAARERLLAVWFDHLPDECRDSLVI
ncbi:MAG: hypothetical protein IT204_03080 [Fimbriimonadaceae bacterium]|nr:hypothetical protein [Fimbriimonadaceae bacterium]